MVECEEAIAGPCNVVCVSKDSRNPQPSDEELKAADFVFYRTFDVQSCTILDKMDDNVGGLEIEYVFNRKKGEKSIPSPGTSDKKEEIPQKSNSSETQKIVTKTVLNILKDAKGDPQDNDGSLKRNAESDKSHDRPLKKIKSDDKCVESGVASGSEKLAEVPSIKSKVDKDKMQVSVVPVVKVENKERNKTPTGLDKSHDQPQKKMKADDKKTPEEKSVQFKVAQSMAADVNNLKTSGTSGTTENQKNGKTSGKMTDGLEGKQLKRTTADGSFKVPADKKPSVHMNEKNSAANSALSQGKLKSGSLESPGHANNMEVKEERSVEKKNKLSMNYPLKASVLSADKDKKNKYREFVITPRPNPETSTSNWFKQRPWEDRLQTAYNQGMAILLHNLKPDYTSEDVENIIWHAFKEYCDAKILPRTAVSSPHYDQALVLLKTKEAAQRILTELDEGCLLSDEWPLVATPCPPISTKKDSTFLGHLAVDKVRFSREDDAVSTSHFSQPNTIEYDMAMEWCLQQLNSEKWWAKLHKEKGIHALYSSTTLKEPRCLVFISI
ncbi:hypothetical protein M8C21_005023 [Ambrosia artemisiifolia]|uniref:Uncharacterized protein n=1 Tax=Ambrosia artemisiifolia TaxID=4212 RepID=A0AAD5GR01_AMBAR|nr:hypothetical protein M8C21_005023 [Ambrosia artemisiifolia]